MRAVLVLAATTFILHGCRSTVVERVRGEGPIVLISIDTLRADRLPAYGYTRIRTPHIDRFVADGVLFEQAYSHSPQTLPAHTSLLSGRLPFEHGVRDNVGFAAKPGERFVQQEFRERGFATAAFVSAYVLRRQTGINQGYDVYDDQLPAASPDRPLGQVQRDGGDTVRAALQWIDRQTSPRFFLFVHTYEPHTPYAPPQRFAAAGPYDGEVEYSDEIVGRLLDHLRAKDLYDRATIVLLSDHGEGLGDHGEDEHGIFLYRETIRVPLVIKLPGAQGGGRRVTAPVQHIDLPPTLLDLAGIRTSNAGRGRSLRPLLQETGALADPDIYSESLSPRYHFGWSELYALTDGRYRFIRAPTDELYDLSQDPGELSSVAAARPQVRAAMRRALDGIIAGAAVSAPAAVSKEDRQKLAALGYVGTQTAAALTLPGDQLPDPKGKLDVLKKYKRATALAGERRLVEATALYRELLREQPEMTDVWLQLADLHARMGMTVASVAAYTEVVKRDPRNAAGLIGAAGGLLQLGRIESARAHAELAVETAPAAARELLARIALERGDWTTARREAQLARAADPALPLPSFVEGAIAYREKRYAAAIPHLLEARNALAGRIDQVRDLNYLAADALARLERYAEAERLFLEELGVFPNHARARAGLAMLYRATGRVTESDRAIADLIRYSPTREGYGLAAQLWTMFGEPARAAAARAEAARLPG
ncbi:MAG TPA: sulfatase-like hydrolase/transferase [Vicinamibacterales bacterium]|nr:sulfatase-like hydrolase/transferase [Vicinamibacterales bacterium]